MSCAAVCDSGDVYLEVYVRLTAYGKATAEGATSLLQGGVRPVTPVELTTSLARPLWHSLSETSHTDRECYPARHR